MLRVLFVSFYSLLALQVNGQLQKTIHQTYTMPDSVATIELSINGPFAVETWPGNVVMSEVRISLYNGSEGLLKHFMESQRYDIMGQVSGDSLRVQSLMMERPEIKTDKGVITELVDVRLFLPDTFESVSEGLWRRKEKPDEPDGEGK